MDIQQVKSIAKGDSSNVYRLTFQNHWGTHIDAPNHFFNEGKRITDYPAHFYFFHFPQVIPVQLKPGEILDDRTWTHQVRKDADIVLFQSGWSQRRRGEDYSLRNPGISPEVGLHLRSRFPNIRAIGIDWISISSYQNRELGREAHRAFFDPKGKSQAILPIEDMDLSGDLSELKEVIVMPLLIEGVDSAPCTVVGVFEK